MTLSVAPAFPNDTPMRVNPAPANPSNSGATPTDSFKSTYNDVQKPNQSDPNSGPDDPNTKTGKTGKERKDARDPGADANNPVIAEVAPQPRPLIPALLFSLPALGEIAQPSNGSESKDGAALSPPPASSLSDRVDAALAPETLDVPSLPSNNQEVPNKDLAFALRLLGQESAANQPLPGAPAASNVIAATTEPAVAPDKALQVSRVAAVNLEVQPALPVAPAASSETPAAVSVIEPLSTVVAPSKTIQAQTIQAQQDLTALPALPAAKPQNTASAGPIQTSPSIPSPKIAPVKQSSANEPVKNNGGSDGPARTAEPAQRPVETRYANMPLTEVRDASSIINSEIHPAEPKPLDTRVEAPAPVIGLVKPSTTPVNEISVRVSGPDQTSAAIRVLDRSGEIRVSVHASDPQLANTLRSDVDELRSHMANRGWDADVWKPEGTATSSTPASVNNGKSESQNPDNSAGRRDAQPQQQSRQQQNNSEKRPEWMDELEASGVKGAA